MVIDPISNFVNGIKNAYTAGKETVEFYNSKILIEYVGAIQKDLFFFLGSSQFIHLDRKVSSISWLHNGRGCVTKKSNLLSDISSFL